MLGPWGSAEHFGRDSRFHDVGFGAIRPASCGQGLITAFSFTGISILQAYQYFPSKDRPIIQLIVRLFDYQYDPAPDPVLGHLYDRPEPLILRSCCSGSPSLSGIFTPL